MVGRKRKKRKVLRWCDRLVRIPNPTLLSTDCTPRMCVCTTTPTYNGGGFDWYDDGSGEPEEFDATTVPDWALQQFVPDDFQECANDIITNGGQPYSSQPGWMSDACWSWWQSFLTAWADFGEDAWAAYTAGADLDQIPNPFRGTFVKKLYWRIYGGSAGPRECHCKNSTLHPENPPETTTICDEGLPICEECPDGPFPDLEIITVG